MKQVVVARNDKEEVWVQTPRGKILAECFFKAEDETPDELRQMGYRSLTEQYESAKFRGDPLQQWALRPTLCAWNNTKHTRTSINCASSCGASVRSSGVDS